MWLAEQHALHRKVAVKVPHTFADEDSRITKRFMREAVTVAQLDHPGIVAIHDFGRTDDGHFYYVMPYLDNGDLRSLEWQGDDHIAQVFTAIADALAYAHDRKVVHRDLKPENILLSSQGQPLIADFGIALTPMGDSRITRDGLTVGSCYYMSPEQARSREIDGRSDIYSVGVMLFEMLTGRVPYDAPDEFSVLLMHANDPLPKLPGSLHNWHPVITRCMAKEPGGRYRDAQALSRAIQTVKRRPPASDTQEHPALDSSATRRLIPLLAVLLIAVALSIYWFANNRAPASGADPGVDATPIQTVSSPDLTDATPQARVRASEAQSADNPNDDETDRNQRLASQLGVELEPRPDARVLVLDEVSGRIVNAVRQRRFEDAVRDAESIKALLALNEISAAEVAPYIDPHVQGWQDALVRADERLDADAARGLARTLAALDRIDGDLVSVAWRADQLPNAGQVSTDSMGVSSAVIPPVAFRPGSGFREVDRGFAMTTREVSRSLYARFIAETGSRDSECTRPGNTVPFIRKNFWHDPGIQQSDSHPAVCVTLDDARAFARWLSAKTGVSYQLPTEHQWLQAAWVDDIARSACGSGNVADRKAVSAGGRGKRFDCDDGFKGTAPTGSYVANRLGVHDLRGNVREWTRTCAREVPDAGQLLDAVGIRDSERCDWRVVRGTSWWDGQNRSMMAFREEMPADKAYAHVGIRLVHDLTITED